MQRPTDTHGSFFGIQSYELVMHLYTVTLDLCVFCDFIVGSFSLLSFSSSNHFGPSEGLLVPHPLCDLYIDRT